MTISYKNSLIHFSSDGKGDAVVLLHGFLENTTMWKDIAPKIATKNRVICIDLPGNGKSECLGYVHTMEEMAVVVKVVLQTLKISKAMFIGHSMGGYVSLAFAEKYPSETIGICLLNSSAQADDDERKNLRLRAVKMAKTHYDSLVLMSVNNLFSSQLHKQFPTVIASCVREALKTPVQGYIACMQGMALRPNREEVLMLAPFKKLLVVGKYDTILCSQLVVDEAVRTNTPVTVLSGGHMSYIENKETLIKELLQFVG